MSHLLPGALLGLVVLAAGCSKHEPPPTANSGPASAADTAPPSPRAPGFLTETSVTAVVSNTGSMDATLAQLTSELRRYVIGTRTVPKNFDDFATKSSLQAPPPPPGKKYAIRGQEVVLVNK